MDNLITFTRDDLELLDEKTVFQGFFTMKKIQFRHKLFAGGWSQVVTREVLIKGAASAVVAYDPEEDAVVMIEQVRIGAYDPQSTSSPWQLELVAGMIASGETAESVAYRESKEEASMQVNYLQQVLSFWDSPGGQRERIYLFVGKVDSRNVHGIHGLADENEDIRVQVIKREIAYQMMNEGKIDNGLAVVGLQWLQLNYQMLQQKWR